MKKLNGCKNKDNLLNSVNNFALLKGNISAKKILNPRKNKNNIGYSYNRSCTRMFGTLLHN